MVEAAYECENPSFPVEDLSRLDFRVIFNILGTPSDVFGAFNQRIERSNQIVQTTGSVVGIETEKVETFGEVVVRYHF